MKNMITKFGRKATILLAGILLMAILLIVYPGKDKNKMISEFGKYQGYSAPIYDGWKRTSDFLRLADGTRLAYDLFIPTKAGVLADKPLPVLFKYTPYDRAWTVFDKQGKFNLGDLGMPSYYGPMARVRTWLVPNGMGNIMDATNRTTWLTDMLKSGYVAIVVDRPGTGASFGTLANEPSVVADEASQIIDWIAAQKWSDGNVGMFGDSIQAQIQFQAASSGNPHLKAILPATTWMDNYSAIIYPGGVHNRAFGNLYAKLNTTFAAMATPVDADKDGALLAQARAERAETSALASGVQSVAAATFRDVMTTDGQNLWIHHQALYPLLDKINASGIPVYLIDGWYDIYARDDIMIYTNLTVPKRLLIRPTDHAGIEAASSDVDYGAEAHRWFDYWLKGVQNGIMDEPPIHYYLQGVDNQKAYQSTNVWPLSNQAPTPYYFKTGISAGSVSVNSGGLDASLPTDPQASDAYTVDYTATTGSTPHWTGLAMPHQYPNMRTHDSKALTYTTPPLENAVVVTGHPIAHIWLSTAAPDLDTFVYLEEVDAAGNSTYITQGELRASLRLLSPAPFANLGLPWHNFYQSEVQPIQAGQPVELVFDLFPTAWQFSPGKQIRITIAFADSGNFDTPVLTPAPKLQILRDADHPSHVEIPVIQDP